MPIFHDSKLESAPGSYYFDKIMDRIKLKSQCQPNNGLVSNQVHKIHLKLNK